MLYIELERAACMCTYLVSAMPINVNSTSFNTVNAQYTHYGEK